MTMTNTGVPESADGPASVSDGRPTAFALLDGFTDAVIVTAVDGRVRYANPAVEELLGWSPSALVGRPLTMFVPARLRPAHERGFARYFSTGEGRLLGRAVQVPALCRDDSEVDVELTLSPLEAEGERVVVGVLRAAGARVELDEDAVIARRLLTVLSEAKPLPEAAPDILAAFGEGLGWDAAELWVVDPEERWLRFVAMWHGPQVAVPNFAAASNARVFGPGSGLPGRVWVRGEPAWIEDVAADENFPRRHAAVADGLRTALAFPVLADGRMLGVIELFSREPRAPDPLLHERLHRLGAHLGRFIARGLDAEALAVSRQRLDLALAAGHMGTWEWEIASGAVTWSASLAEIFGMPAQPWSGSFEDYLARVHADDRDDVQARLHAAVEGTGQLHQEHRLVTADGEVRWVEVHGRLLHDEAGHLTMVGVAADVTERKSVEERERQARVALEESQQRLAFLAEASALLGSSLNEQTTCRMIVDLVVPALADTCIVHSSREDGAFLPVAAADADRAVVALLERMPPIHPDNAAGPEGLARVLHGGEPLLYAHVGDEVLRGLAVDEEHLGLLRRLKVCSAMVVPLTARGRTLGALTLLATSSRRYGPDDLALAEELAGRAALAVDNARLYQDRTRTTRALQRSLLPPQLPDIPGVEVAARYHAAGEGQVGGDFYDLFPLPGGAWGVVVGDVRGKGPAAAAITALARHTVRAASLHASSPAGVLATLNEAMVQRAEDDPFAHFCTLVFAELRPDAEGTLLTVSSGGHPLPLVLARDGDVRPVGGGGMLVGAFADAEFSVEQIRLGDGDTVIFYTDGVTEARVRGELFGEQGLESLLRGSAGECAEELVTRVEQAVTQTGSLRDDLAVVAVRVLGRPRR